MPTATAQEDRGDDDRDDGRACRCTGRDPPCHHLATTIGRRLICHPASARPACTRYPPAGVRESRLGGGTRRRSGQRSPHRSGFSIVALLLTRFITRLRDACRRSLWRPTGPAEAELGLSGWRQPRGNQPAPAGQADIFALGGRLPACLIDAPADMRPTGLLVGNDPESG